MDHSKLHALLFVTMLTGIFWTPQLHADQRKIDPTFLYRNTSAVKERNPI